MSSNAPENDKLSMAYVIVRARQFDGTFSADPNLGGWAITTSRVLFGLGIVTELEWPISVRQMHDNWPPAEPGNLDLLAHRRRTEWHVRVRTADHCEEMLARGATVSVDVKVTASWREPSDGRVVYDPEADGILGSHSVVLESREFAGIEVPSGYLTFANSWGAAWGIGGWGLVHKSELNQMILEGWAKPPGFAKESPKSSAQLRLLRHVYRIGEGLSLHRFILVDPKRDRRLGWLFAVTRNGSLEAEDLFVLPEHRRLGYGRLLLNTFIAEAKRIHLPYRLWIPFADWNGSSRTLLSDFFRQCDLFIQPPAVTWAAAVASAESYDGPIPPPTEHETPTYSLARDQERDRRARFNTALEQTNRQFGRALNRLAE